MENKNKNKKKDLVMVSAMKNLNKAKGISAHWEGYFRYDGQGCLLREGDI